jgi:hypothetical protein
MSSPSISSSKSGTFSKSDELNVVCKRERGTFSCDAKAYQWQTSPEKNKIFAYEKKNLSLCWFESGTKFRDFRREFIKFRVLCSKQNRKKVRTKSNHTCGWVENIDE